MVKRLAVAAVGIPAAFCLVYLGGWALAATLSVLGVLGALEVYRLAGHRAVQPLTIVGLVGAVGMPALVLALLPGRGLGPRWSLLLGAAWLIAIMLCALRSRSPEDHPLPAVSITAFGAVYTAGLPAFLLWLRESPVAPSAWAASWLVFLPLVLTWICDSLAMLAGATIGGPKLAPVLSPKKTWSGAIAGAVGATVLAPVYGWLVLVPLGIRVPLAALLLTGLGVGTLGQLGDLAESLFKREAGVKDSGTFFPGHGGVLDRLDSLYWGIPVTVIILRAFAIV
jgi:phosphatidate cytidylyltransferase